jgi:hypothetical protein
MTIKHNKNELKIGDANFPESYVVLLPERAEETKVE